MFHTKSQADVLLAHGHAAGYYRRQVILPGFLSGDRVFGVASVCQTSFIQQARSRKSRRAYCMVSWLNKACRRQVRTSNAAEARAIFRACIRAATIYIILASRRSLTSQLMPKPPVFPDASQTARVSRVSSHSLEWRVGGVEAALVMQPANTPRSRGITAPNMRSSACARCRDFTAMSPSCGSRAQPHTGLHAAFHAQRRCRRRLPSHTPITVTYFYTPVEMPVAV